jgi:hypothetical protein
LAVETIRDYLIGLGFKVDEASLGKFSGAIAGSLAPVLKLGGAVAATAAAVEIMVEQVGRQMEDLYYAAQRANVAATSLMAVSFAAKQVGLSAGDGAELVEALARSMRASPGVATVVTQLGGELQTVNGQLGITDRGLRSMLENLAAMPRYQALAYAGTLGLDPEALNQILNNLPAFFEGMNKAQDIINKVGLPPNAAKDFAEFDRNVNTLEQHIGTLAERIAHDWIPSADRMIDRGVRLLEVFEKFNKEHGGVPGQTASAVTAAGGLAGLLSIFGWGRALLGTLLRGGAASAPMALTSFAGEPVPESEVTARMRANPIGDLYKWITAPRAAHTSAPPEDYPLGVRSNNPGNLQPGGIESTFGSPLEGLQAMAGNLLRYGRRGWDTVESIVSHWAPEKGKNDVASYISDVVGRTGFAADRHLDLTDTATLSAMMRAMTIHEQGYNPYARDMYDLAASSRAGSATLNQKTEIIVNGAGSPAAVSRRVADEQERVNGDAVRNLGGVVR